MSTTWSDITLKLIRQAVAEDLGDVGDITSALLPPASDDVAAAVRPRADGVICGLQLAPLICDAFAERLDTQLRIVAANVGDRAVTDGDAVTAGDTVATLRGPRPAVLTCERTLLNFLGRMSGVATLTRRYIDAARPASPDVKIYDTRKTLPGWRELDKYAVRTGGGHNHRDGLYDAILIKDNHLAGVPLERLANTLFDMLNAAAESAARPKFVEVEVDNLDQLAEVFKVVGVDVVLLDNFSVADLKQAVEMRDSQGLRGKLELEASGGVTLDSVQQIASAGIDRIAIGQLTHSAPSLDIALDL